MPSKIMTLVPCVACHRLVRTAERACPFCQALRGPTRARAALPPTRMSRAAWLIAGPSVLALGSLATACTSGVASTALPDGGVTQPSGTLALVFPCGEDTCIQGLEYCFVEVSDCGGTASPSCYAKPSRDYPHCLDSCDTLLTCLGNDGSYASNATCDEAAGGPTITADQGSCHGCYGCPPARLERLAASASA